MAFVDERIPKEEWDFVRKYSQVELFYNTHWKVDREREIYFIRLGHYGNEPEFSYLLIWRGKKVFIDTWEGTHSMSDTEYKPQGTYRIWDFQADKALEPYREELIEIVKEVLQVGRKNPIIIEKMVEPDFVEVKYN